MVKWTVLFLLLALPVQASVSLIPVAEMSSENPLIGQESRLFVQSVQEMLAKAGYLERAEVNGLLGIKTEDAIRRFEKDNGLRDDGRLTPKVFELLAKKIRN